MKFKLVLLILFLPWWCAGQSIDKVYSMVLDSSEYVRNMEYIAGKVFFEKGRYLPFPSPHCGNSGPSYIPDNNIYTIESNTVTPFIESHLDKSKQTSYSVIDSANLLSRYEYFGCTDSSGVFLPIRLSNHYWTYLNQKISLITLGKDTLISSYYPKWFKDKMLVYMRDDSISSQLYYFDRASLRLHPFLKSKHGFRVHNPIIIDSLLLFNTYHPKTKDHQVYTSDYVGNIHRITHFPRGLYHFNKEVAIDSMLYLRLQNKGIPDNYDNKLFAPTTFWTLNLRTKKMSQFKEMPKYGITYRSTNLNGHFATLFGYHEYDLYGKDKFGKFANLLGDAKEVKHCLYTSVKLNTKLLVVGVDHDNHHRLVLVGSSDQPAIITAKFAEIKLLKSWQDKGFFLTFNKDKTNSIKMITNEGQVKRFEDLDKLEEVMHFEMLEYNGHSYLLLTKKAHSELHKIDIENHTSELMLNNITNTSSHRMKINDRRKANYQATDHGIYFITRDEVSRNKFDIFYLN